MPTNTPSSIVSIVHTTKYLDKILNIIAVQLYQLCGDKINKNVKQRYFRTNKTPRIRSLHYFYYYAVKDRLTSVVWEKSALHVHKLTLNWWLCHSYLLLRMTKL